MIKVGNVRMYGTPACTLITNLPSPPKSHAEVSSMDLKGNLSTKNYRDIF